MFKKKCDSSHPEQTLCSDWNHNTTVKQARRYPNDWQYFIRGTNLIFQFQAASSEEVSSRSERKAQWKPHCKPTESRIMFRRSKTSCHLFVVWTDVPLAAENLFHKQMVSTCCTFPFPLAMQHTSSFAQLADRFLCVVQQNQSFKIKQQEP